MDLSHARRRSCVEGIQRRVQDRAVSARHARTGAVGVDHRLAQVQNPNRANLDIVSDDPNFGALKVSPVFQWSDAEMEAYLKKHNLPNEWDYFDPAKADEKRECGLHVAWGGQAVSKS